MATWQPSIQSLYPMISRPLLGPATRPGRGQRSKLALAAAAAARLPFKKLGSGAPEPPSPRALEPSQDHEDEDEGVLAATWPPSLGAREFGKWSGGAAARVSERLPSEELKAPKLLGAGRGPPGRPGAAKSWSMPQLPAVKASPPPPQPLAGPPREALPVLAGLFAQEEDRSIAPPRGAPPGSSPSTARPGSGADRLAGAAALPATVPSRGHGCRSSVYSAAPALQLKELKEAYSTAPLPQLREPAPPKPPRPTPPKPARQRPSASDVVMEVCRLRREMAIPHDDMQTAFRLFKAHAIVPRDGCLLHDGHLTKAHLGTIMGLMAGTCRLDLEEEEGRLIETAFKAADEDGNGTLNFREFATWFSSHSFDEGPLQLEVEELELRRLGRRLGLHASEIDWYKRRFGKFDTDGSGLLDREEFEQMLYTCLDIPRHIGLPQSRIQQMWVHADTDREGQLDLEKFVVFHQKYFSQVGDRAGIEMYYTQGMMASSLAARRGSVDDRSEREG